MDGIARLLNSAYTDKVAGFVPFSVAGEIVGWLRPVFAQVLHAFPDVFVDDAAGAVQMHPRLDQPDARGHAMADVVRELARTALITGWRDELYPVHSDGARSEPALLTIERAAARAFGITSHAVHVNGVVTSGAAPEMWIARRSLSKPIDPGMLDNMIGGGLTAGLSVGEALVKEGWEEAGLGPEQLAAATSGRLVRIRREVPEGLQSEIIHVHDLELPPAVTPRNTDGEVSEFQRLQINTVLELLDEGNQITPDASLVILDWLDRRGLAVLPDSPQVRAIFSSAPSALPFH